MIHADFTQFKKVSFFTRTMCLPTTAECFIRYANGYYLSRCALTLSGSVTLDPVFLYTFERVLNCHAIALRTCRSNLRQCAYRYCRIQSIGERETVQVPSGWIKMG